jgi:hypothetical protein
VLLAEGKDYEYQILFYLKSRFPGCFQIESDEIPEGFRDQEEWKPFDLSGTLRLMPMAKFKFEKSIKAKINDLNLEANFEKFFVNTP